MKYEYNVIIGNPFTTKFNKCTSVISIILESPNALVIIMTAFLFKIPLTSCNYVITAV